MLDRQVRTGRGQRRVLEDDDAADQVDARRASLPGDSRGLVVRLRRADLPRERARGHQEADLAVLVLDVELERGQARDREVLVELARLVGERHRHVDAAHLARERRPLDRLLVRLRRLRLGSVAAGPVTGDDCRAEGDERCDDDQRAERDGSSQPVPMLARLDPPLSKTLVWVAGLGQGCGKPRWPSSAAQQNATRLGHRNRAQQRSRRRGSSPRSREKRRREPRTATRRDPGPGG